MDLVGRVMGRRIKEETEKLEDGDSVTHAGLAVEIELEPDMRTNLKKPSKAVLLVPIDQADEYPLEAPVRISVLLPQTVMALDENPDETEVTITVPGLKPIETTVGGMERAANALAGRR